MRPVRAFVLGTVAAAVLAYATAATVGLGVAAAGGEVHVAVGPATLVAVDRTAEGAVATFGPGLLVVAVVAGLANGAVAFLLARRVP